MNQSSTPPLFPLAWLPWVAALGFALLAGLLGRTWLAARAENSRLRQEAALASVETRSLDQRLRAERLLASHRAASLLAELGDRKGSADIRLSVLTTIKASESAPLVVVAWSPKTQRGVLAASGLPAAGADREYRLWILGANEQPPADCGTVAVDSESGGALVPFGSAQPVADAGEFVLCLHSAGNGIFAEGRAVSRGR